MRDSASQEFVDHAKTCVHCRHAIKSKIKNQVVDKVMKL